MPDMVWVVSMRTVDLGIRPELTDEPAPIEHHRRKCRELTPKMIEVLIAAAEGGDVKAAIFIVEQAYGKAQQSVEQRVETVDRFSRMSRAEVAAEAKRLADEVLSERH